MNLSFQAFGLKKKKKNQRILKGPPATHGPPCTSGQLIKGINHCFLWVDVKELLSQLKIKAYLQVPFTDVHIQ